MHLRASYNHLVAVTDRTWRSDALKLLVSAFHPLQTLAAETAFNSMRVWLLFWLFVAVSWLAVGSYIFIAGWSDCYVSGTCAAD